jgi:diguanylate cyclase (GGDEF)-like protein
MDASRRRGLLRLLLPISALLVVVVAGLSYLEVIDGSAPIQLVVAGAAMMSWWLNQRGHLTAAFALLAVTLVVGVSIRVLLTGDAAAAFVYWPVAGMVLLLAAPRRWALVAFGGAALTYLIIVATSSPEETASMVWASMAADGVMVTAMVLALVFATMRSSHQALAEAFTASDEAARLAAELARAQRQLEAEVHSRTADLRDVLDETDQLIAELAASAMRDHLTGLHNRRFLDNALPAMTQAAAGSGASVAIMMVDLVNFKQVNDTLGHQVGDQVVREVAHRLAGSLVDGDVLCRFGGDEFVVLLSSPASDHLDATVARMQQALARHDIDSAADIDISFAHGYASLTGDEAAALSPDAAADQLLRRAATDLQRRRKARSSGSLT